MKRNQIKLFLIVIFIFYGCSRKTDPVPQLEINCSDFAAALLEKDNGKVKSEILRVIGPFNFNISHEENFKKIFDKVNECPGLAFVSACFECIETNPAKTEITIFINQNNQQVVRDIYLHLDENNVLSVNIHD